MEPFTVQAVIDRRKFNLFVNFIRGDKAWEYYQVQYGRWTYLFKTNRPVFMTHRLKHRPWSWELLEGKFAHRRSQEQMEEALERALKERYPI